MDVLETLVKFGAPDEILIQAKPHVGTDVLRAVVKRLRTEIISQGGEVRFNTKLTGIAQSGGRICGVYVQHNGGIEKSNAPRVYLLLVKERGIPIIA